MDKIKPIYASSIFEVGYDEYEDMYTIIDICTGNHLTLQYNEIEELSQQLIKIITIRSIREEE